MYTIYYIFYVLCNIIRISICYFRLPVRADDFTQCKHTFMWRVCSWAS